MLQNHHHLTQSSSLSLSIPLILPPSHPHSLSHYLFLTFLISHNSSLSPSLHLTLPPLTHPLYLHSSILASPPYA